jgi:hypothetical protein
VVPFLSGKLSLASSSIYFKYRFFIFCVQNSEVHIFCKMMKRSGKNGCSDHPRFFGSSRWLRFFFLPAVCVFATDFFRCRSRSDSSDKGKKAWTKSGNFWLYNFVFCATRRTGRGKISARACPWQRIAWWEQSRINFVRAHLAKIGSNAADSKVPERGAISNCQQVVILTIRRWILRVFCADINRPMIF